MADFVDEGRLYFFYKLFFARAYLFDILLKEGYLVREGMGNVEEPVFFRVGHAAEQPQEEVLPWTFVLNGGIIFYDDCDIGKVSPVLFGQCRKSLFDKTLELLPVHPVGHALFYTRVYPKAGGRKERYARAKRRNDLPRFPKAEAPLPKAPKNAPVDCEEEVKIERGQRVRLPKKNWHELCFTRGGI